MKWREERALKKGNEPQKKSFVVRHVKHDKDASLFASAMNKAKKGAPLIKPSQFAVPVDKPAKQATRASARIAKQASSNLPTDLKNHAAKKMAPKSKATAIDKIKEKVSVYCFDFMHQSFLAVPIALPHWDNSPPPWAPPGISIL